MGESARLYRSYFNPRSREGSDADSKQRYTRLVDFNPRSREGSDADRLLYRLEQLGISIHAPAKGATELDIFKGPEEIHFNPRSREGSDILLL